MASRIVADDARGDELVAGAHDPLGQRVADLSSAAVRVSETVSTAIRSGWKARVASIRAGNGLALVFGGRRHRRPAVLGQRLQRRAGLARGAPGRPRDCASTFLT